MKSCSLVKVILVIFVLITPFSDAFGRAVGPKDNANLGTDLPMLKGALIQIEAYHADTRSYDVTSVRFPDERVAYVTPEGLAKAIPSISLKQLIRNPRSIVNSQLRLDNDLPTLLEAERDARKRSKSAAHK